MLEILQKGGVLILPIIICSLVGAFVFFQRIMQLGKVGDQMSLVKAVCKMVADADFDEAKIFLNNISRSKISPAERIVLEALSVDDIDRETMETVVTHGVAREIQHLAKHMGLLATMGNVTPLLGLLGTVIGMIKAFVVVESMGGRVNSSMLAGGIWEAMLTTAFGLSAAIPLILCHSYLESRLNVIQARLEEVAIAFLKSWAAGNIKRGREC